MPFRKTGERSYEIDYDLDSGDKRIDFTSQLREHKMGCAIYNEYINMKNQAKRRDWMAFYRSFVNQICPVLRYYVKLEEI